MDYRIKFNLGDTIKTEEGRKGFITNVELDNYYNEVYFFYNTNVDDTSYKYLEHMLFPSKSILIEKKV